MESIKVHEKRRVIVTKSLVQILLLLFILFFPWVGTGHADSSNVVKIGSDLTIERDIKVRNVLVIGGQITVEGTVENRVIAIGGPIVLTGTSEVGGDVFALGGIVVRGKGARVHGNITEINTEDISDAISTALSDEWEGWSWIFAIISISIFLGVLVLTVLVVFFIPGPLRVISEAVREKPFKAMMLGVVGFMVVVPLAVLLAMSVVGIFLIPLEMVIVLCAVLLGFIAISHLVGNYFLTMIKRKNRSVMRETIWGLIILWVIGWVPYVGWIIKVTAIVLGLGGVIVTRFGTLHRI